jgi:hypothetical protein
MLDRPALGLAPWGRYPALGLLQGLLAALKKFKMGQAERIEKCLLAIAFEQPKDQCEEVFAYAARTETTRIGIATAIVA